MNRILFQSFICCLVFAVRPVLAEPPLFVTLTWQGDTSTTMTVNYHTDENARSSEVLYDVVSHRGNSTAYAYRAKGTYHQIEGLSGRLVHVVELTHLEAGRPYYFIAGDPQSGYTEEHKFRTIPNDGSSVRFVSGGDMGIGKQVDRLLIHAAAQAPDFAMIGGDIAYVNGQIKSAGKWDVWLKSWEEYMVTPEGFSIPLALAVGNHEVRKDDWVDHRSAPFYFGYFAQNGTTSYFRRQFGPHFTVYFLDTGHVTPHIEQVPWLENCLLEDREIPFRFAIYHVPLYPSHRDYNGNLSQAGREHWRPVFDRLGLTAAFENHDHTFKVTHSLRDNKINPDGVLYLGDGTWGRDPRSFPIEPKWYLRKFKSVAHFWVGDISADSAAYYAVDDSGMTFFSHPAEPEGSTTEVDAYYATLPVNYEIHPESIKVSPLLLDKSIMQKETIRVTVENREKFPANAVFEFRPDPPLMVEPAAHRFLIQENEKWEITFEIKSNKSISLADRPSGNLEYTLDYKTPNETVRFEGSQPIVAEHSATAPIGQTPVINGVLDDWIATPFRFDQPAQIFTDGETPPWSGPEDCSLEFGVIHDKENLYLGIRVTDDKVSLSEVPIAWYQDSLQVWITSYPEGDFDDDPLFALNPGKSSGKGHFLAIESPPADMETACVTTDEGYTCEIAVPLSYLRKIRVERGGEGPLRQIRLNFAIGDKDEPNDPMTGLYWRPRWDVPGDYTWSGVFSLE